MSQIGRRIQHGRWKSLCLGLGVLFALSSLHVMAIEPAANKNYMGVNVWFLSDFDKASPFADLAKSSRPWLKFSNWDLMTNIDSMGWPREDGKVTVSSKNTLKAGVYKISFSGSASVVAYGAGTLSNASYNSSLNRTTIDWTLSADLVTPTGSQNNNVWIAFSNTKRTANSSANTGITNLKIMRPGYTTQTFTTEFVGAMNKFESIRFMDWVDANRNPSENWTDRTTPQHATQARMNASGNQMGVAVEYMIELCNLTDSDLWINIPCRASDNYVTQLAQLIKNGNSDVAPLNSNLKVYVEYGNEIWNYAAGFMCYQWIHGEFVPYIRANQSWHAILSDGDQGEYGEITDFTAWKGAEISLIFRSVFGNSAMMTRVRPVYGYQVGNANEIFKNGLEFVDSYYPNPPNYYFYAGAGGAYFDSDYLTPKNSFFANIPSANFKGQMSTDSVWSYAYGLKHFCYEGGVGLANAVNQSATLTEAEMEDYNADYRMKQTVIDGMNEWSSYGGDLHMFYVIAGATPWAYTPNILETITSPKLQGIDALKWSAKAAVTVGTVIPATLDARFANDRVSIGNWDSPEALSLRNAVFFPLNTTSATTMTVKFDYKKRLEPSSSFRVWVNGVDYGTKTVPATGDSYATRDVFSFTTKPGVNVLRIEMTHPDSSSNYIDLRNVIVGSGGTVTPPPVDPPSPSDGGTLLLETTKSGYDPWKAAFKIQTSAGKLLKIQRLWGNTGSSWVTIETAWEVPGWVTTEVWYTDEGSGFGTTHGYRVYDASGGEVTPPPGTETLILTEAKRGWDPWKVALKIQASAGDMLRVERLWGNTGSSWETIESAWEVPSWVTTEVWYTDEGSGFGTIHGYRVYKIGGAATPPPSTETLVLETTTSGYDPWTATLKISTTAGKTLKVQRLWGNTGSSWVTIDASVIVPDWVTDYYYYSDAGSGFGTTHGYRVYER